ncbi:MAG: hypothetical protein WBJ75_01210 [Pseudohongiellaceae bacterium]
MGHAQLSDKVRELDARLTHQTVLLRQSYAGRQVYFARWSPLLVKVAGLAAAVTAVRIGPVKLVSLVMAVSRLWPQVVAFRPK